jgi:hypothetical protein
MKQRNFTYYDRSTEKYTAFERKLQRYTQDPIRYYEGRPSNDDVPTIKGRRLA